MTLKTFIKELQKIEEKFGGDAQVTMADNIPVIEPVFLEKDRKVVITDQR